MNNSEETLKKIRDYHEKIATTFLGKYTNLELRCLLTALFMFSKSTFIAWKYSHSDAETSTKYDEFLEGLWECLKKDISEEENKITDRSQP